MRIYFQYLIAIYFLLSVLPSNSLMAQTYTLNPGRTFIINVDTSENNFDGIEITNINTQNLNLTWRLALKDTLNDCTFELCNSGTCFMNLPFSGTMPTIAPGGIGWIKFHMFSGVTNGTNTLKYVLKNGLIQSDTLTFIIVVGHTTGLKKQSMTKGNFSLYPNPATNETNIKLILDKPENSTIIISDMFGRTVYQSYKAVSIGTNNISIDTRNLASGMYNVTINTASGSITKKLSVTN